MVDNLHLRNTFRVSSLWLIGLIGFLSSPFSRAFTIRWDASADSAPSVQVLANGSFESDFDGWTGSGNRVVRWAAPDTAPDGGKLVSFNGTVDSDSPANGVLSQTFATIPGTTYTLAFYMGVAGANPGEQRLEITVAGAGNLLSQIVSKTSAGGGTAQWGAQAYTFVANSTTTTLTFRDVSTVTVGINTLLDNVRVTSANPKVLGYRVRYGNSSGAYTKTLDVGTATSATLNDPPAGITYYATVTAYASASIESPPSAEVSYTGKADLATQPPQAGTGNSDFNRDGIPDTLWSDPISGEVTIRLRNGSTSGETVVSLGFIALDWQIAGSADFNWDGSVDILWQNLTTGRRVIIFLDGLTWPGNISDLGTVALEWSIAGTGDFNWDRSIDIIFENTTTGQRVIAFLDGVTWPGNISDLGTVPLEWSIAGTGDFNWDGSIDILFENTTTGQRVIAFMDGIKWPGNISNVGTIPLEWSIIGTGEFNGDGSIDIIYQNTATGQRVVTFMDGATWPGNVWDLGIAGSQP